MTTPTAIERLRFAQARGRGQRDAMRTGAVVAVRYDDVRDLLELTQRNGTIRRVQRSVLPELDGVPVTILQSVTVSPAGDAISWRELDVDVSVRGLLERERRSRGVDFDGRDSQTT